MNLSEQCGSDLAKCEEDLEDNGYTVYAPTEKADICDENPVIKCVYDTLTTGGVSDMSINSSQSSTKDCYVLAKSVKKEGSLPKFNFTFWSDNQVYLSVKLGATNNNDKLVYRGKFECDGSNIKILKFNYQGIWGGSSITAKDEKVKDTSGNAIEITSSESASLNIPSGDLYYKNYLTAKLQYNVNSNSTELTKIIEILTT